MGSALLNQTEAAAALLADDSKYIWHPFTQMQTAPPPIPISRGEGAMLYGLSDDSYIDAVSSWWVNIHGHAHPHIADRVSEQLRTLEHVIFAGFTHPPAVELGKKLVAVLPGEMQRVFFSDNGSTSVEVGIKMALQYWFNAGSSRKRIVAFEHAYHGDTFGAMSVSGRSKFNEAFNPYLFDVHHIPAPLPGQEAKSLEALEQQLATGEVAALIYEPLIQGAAGMLMQTTEGLAAVLAAVKSAGGLLVADEVMTGFGRTGTMFASEQMETQPDIICLSKGLTGGTMALGITASTEAVYEAFLSSDYSKTFFHGHSFTANPLACTSALASLELYNDECRANISRIAASHRVFLQRLTDDGALSDLVANPRQHGTVCAFEVSVGEENSYFHTIRDRLYDFAMERGVLLRPLGNTLYIMPPYCITDEQLSLVYQVIVELLTELKS